MFVLEAFDDVLNGRDEAQKDSYQPNVAGVYKYKQHKLTAQKEIDQTVDNLNRVDDIIHESSWRNKA